MKTALILGGTGAVGWATARRLSSAGWKVRITGRNPVRIPEDLRHNGVVFERSDRGNPEQLTSVLSSGADLLVDCVCFTGEQAGWLLPQLGSFGSAVLISSKAVYVDPSGNHSNSDEQPRFPTPISEDNPTLPPGSIDYRSREGYGPNKVAAERVLLDSGFPVSVLRPSKIHGAGSTNPREWFFVKRILDRRPALVLAQGGRNIDHTSAAANIAALVETVADNPAARILNSADPDAPSALEIAHTIGKQMNYEWNEQIFDAGSFQTVGDHPWNVAFPRILDMSAASALGYRPVGSYAETAGAEIDWLLDQVTQCSPGSRNPEWMTSFDYTAEDEFLSGIR